MNISVLWRFIPTVFLFAIWFTLSSKDAVVSKHFLYAGITTAIIAVLWNWIANTTIRIYNNRNAIGTWLGNMPEKLWKLVKKAFTASSPHIQRGTERTAEATIRSAGFLWRHYWLKPWLWSGVIAGLFSIYFAYQGVSDESWKFFHYSLASASVSTLLITVHFDALDELLDTLWRNKVMTWAVLSGVWFVLALIHCSMVSWTGILMPFLSTVAAVITIGNHWGTVGNWTISLFEKGGELAGKFLHWCFTTPAGLIVVAFGFFLAAVVSDDRSSQYNFFVIAIFLLFVGGGWQVKKIRDRD